LHVLVIIADTLLVPPPSPDCCTRPWIELLLVLQTQAPAASHNGSQAEMNGTFTLLNVSPQVGVGFNRLVQLWLQLYSPWAMRRSSSAHHPLHAETTGHGLKSGRRTSQSYARMCLSSQVVRCWLGPASWGTAPKGPTALVGRSVCMGREARLVAAPVVQFPAALQGRSSCRSRTQRWVRGCPRHARPYHSWSPCTKLFCGKGHCLVVVMIK
jgi:hypothetical protein